MAIGLTVFKKCLIKLTDEMIEEQLISTFKSLGINEDQFIKFFNENLDQSWRINNRNQGLFLSARKYQANSLVRFSDIEEYNPKYQNRILNSNPKLSQQTIMPNNEILRLKNKFIKFKTNNLNLPDFILIGENQNFNNYEYSLYKHFLNFDNDKYCNIYSSKTYILFYKNEICG